MVPQNAVLICLLLLVEQIPVPPAEPGQARRGRPAVYSDRLLLKAVVIMVVRRLPTVHALLAVLDQPEMASVRALLGEGGHSPSRRTWERRLKAVPSALPAQIACLGEELVQRLQPWLQGSRAAAIDSTPLAARGGVWHKKHREAGIVPHTPHAHRHGSPLDQVRLARLGLRLEAAPAGERGPRRVDPAGR